MPRPELFETSPFPIVILNIETLKILQTNQAARDFFGYHGHEMPNRGLHDICAADGVHRILAGAAAQQELTNRQPYQVDGVQLLPENEPGKPVALVCYFSATDDRLYVEVRPFTGYPSLPHLQQRRGPESRMG